jgi:hypothetical protein
MRLLSLSRADGPSACAPVAEIEATGTEAFDFRIMLKPGARLVRELVGQMHTVVVLENGFDYDGDHYSSLSQIAARITGRAPVHADPPHPHTFENFRPSVASPLRRRITR